ncbi:MAG: M23 family metallopeptidase [Chloroflexi bacterium]|nr:M23 family metallopeptidase [Chloroflexota bacterium]
MRKRPFYAHPNFQGLLVLAVVVGLGIFYLAQNDQPEQRFARPVPVTPTNSSEPPWRVALESQLDQSLTQIPTATQPTSEYVPPTLALDPSATPQILQVTQIRANITLTSTSLPLLRDDITPTATNTNVSDRSTPVPSPTGVDELVIPSESKVEQFQPPAEEVPLSLQPYDHFFFRRPVDASANSRSIFYYPYGARYSGSETRIHHGVDMPNPIGEEVLAGSSGTVIWAGSVTEDTTFGSMEVYASYGKVVVIEHDFTYQGQKLWTLYAHLSVVFVEAGAQVEMSDVIGLTGNTGIVTGPHVHFEVRLGVNDYWNTRNPLMWIAPFLDHGVVAGRIIDEQGVYIDGVNLQLLQGGRTIDRTVTYIRPKGGGARQHRVVPDDNWQENFAMGDVPAGQYQVVAIVQGRRFTETITVRPGMVNWVEFQVNPPESTAVPTPDE